jgi:serine/threonine protein kinase
MALSLPSLQNNKNTMKQMKKMKKLLNIIITTIKKQPSSASKLTKIKQPAISDISYLNNIPELKYEFKEFLGSGVFGNIYKVNPRTQPQSQPHVYPKNIVCKVIKLNSKNKQYILKELEILNILSEQIASNQYIIPCIEHIFHNNKAYIFFQNTNCYTVADAYPRLNVLMKSNSSLYNQLIKYIIKHILHGLSTIHIRNIAHQNLDNSSIVLSKNLENINDVHDLLDIQIKIIDFGLSCGLLGNDDKQCLDNPNYFINSQITTTSNTLQSNMYLTQNNKTYNNLQLAKAFDVWCCGKVLYEILHNNQPKIKKTINTTLENNNSWYSDFKINNSLTNSTAYAIREYNNIIETFMLVPIINRKPVNIVLEKILLLEKY